jgi:phosphoribosyl-ATP pyrophosphohydrolase/phosphoribosyl-AMP cyclohydrolase
MSPDTPATPDTADRQDAPGTPDGLAALAWDRSGGLVPAIVQHARTHRVLMLGWMDRAALEATLATRRVTFFSRSRGRLWMKGETSGHVLELQGLQADCDRDALLVQALPRGPTCHTGTASCFPDAPDAFFSELDDVIARRERQRPPGSYTARLFDAGVRAVAQKVGEEGVETALAAVVQDDAALLGEAADLLFHLTVLLRARGLGLADVEAVLRARHAAP